MKQKKDKWCPKVIDSTTRRKDAEHAKTAYKVKIKIFSWAQKINSGRSCLSKASDRRLYFELGPKGQVEFF